MIEAPKSDLEKYFRKHIAYYRLEQPELVAALTDLELAKLVYFKARYRREVAGFTHEQADRLIFMQWMHQQRKLTDFPKNSLVQTKSPS